MGHFNATENLLMERTTVRSLWQESEKYGGRQA